MKLDYQLFCHCSLGESPCFLKKYSQANYNDLAGGGMRCH